uniref:Putative Octicosapeptide/Phox/Bem1p family protein isoform 1 n=1 Tax=Davidia involucrata TaxID=16924 RepID=A0A5B6ZZM6_DAVIN
MVGPSLNTDTRTTTIKFLCSYGGKILPRHPDGKLRYHGGETRVLAVDRSISFAELLVKLGELCGKSVSLRCQLPTEDLDALVSITSDEDLANLIEEYDRAASPPSSLKIRAFLSPPKSSKKISPPPSTTASSSTDAASSKSSSSYSTAAAVGSTSSSPPSNRCFRHISAPVVFPLCYEKSAGKLPHYAYHAHGNPSHIYLIHNGHHWQ